MTDQSAAASLPFVQEWICWGMPILRECEGTYCAVPLDSVPRLDIGDNLDWLVPVDPLLAAQLEEEYANNPFTMPPEEAEGAGDSWDWADEERQQAVRAGLSDMGIEMPPEVFDLAMRLASDVITAEAPPTTATPEERAAWESERQARIAAALDELGAHGVQLPPATLEFMQLPSADLTDDESDIPYQDPFAPTPEEQAQWERERRELPGRIMAEAEDKGIHLPRAFTELIQSDDLMNRILDPTGCYFHLADTISPAPFGLDGHLYRFLCDQQGCLMWYLYLPREGEPVVLASADELDDLSNYSPAELEAAENQVVLVAHSFAEFIYRFWIEGMLCLKINRSLPLSPAEAAYIGPEGERIIAAVAREL